MDKNILIIGAPRCGKTSLSRKIAKEYGYSIIALDDIICAFEGMPECGIRHDGNAIEIAEKFGRFLKGYLKELSEGPNFYGGIKYVIEGTHIDLKQIMPMLNEDKYKKKYFVLGLLFDDMTADNLFDHIKKYDTEDDWTYWCNDESLKEKCECFVWKNALFRDEFAQWGIKTYKVGEDRETAFNEICKELL